MTRQEAIHARLRRHRIDVMQRGLRETARQLGVSAPYLTAIEQGQRRPAEALMQRMADVYGLDIAELRAGWSRPEAIVTQVASQDSVAAAKVPMFLRTARHLNADQWDQLIAQAKKLSQPKRSGS